MAKGCVYIPKTGKDAGKVFGSKDSLAAHMNYTPAMADVMARYEKTGGAMNLDGVTKWLTDNGYLKAEAKKPTTEGAKKEPVFNDDIKTTFKPSENLLFNQGGLDNLQTQIGVDSDIKSRYKELKKEVANALKKIGRVFEGEKVDLRGMSEQAIVDYANTLDELDVKNQRYGGKRAKITKSSNFGRDIQEFDGRVIGQGSFGIRIVTDDGTIVEGKKFSEYTPKAAPKRTEGTKKETPGISKSEQAGLEILNKYGVQRFTDWLTNQPLVGGFFGIRDIANKYGIKFPQTVKEFDAEVDKNGGIDNYMGSMADTFMSKMKQAPAEKKPTTKKEFPKAPVTDAVKTALKSVDNTTAAIMNLAKVLPTVYESIAKQVKLGLGKPASQQIAEAYHNAVENGVEPELVAAVENAVALQEQMKSKPSMASDIETAETLEVEGVPNGVRVSNKASMAELERRNSGNATKKATIAMARAAAKTLKSVFPMMDIHLHENTADYNNAMSNLNAQRNTAGNFTYSTSSDGTVVGRIDIDLNKAVPRTVAHEVVHAVLLKTFGDSSPAFLEFRKNLEKIVSKSGNARLQRFVDQYKEVADETGQAEEYLAELGGILSDKEKPLEYGIVRNIAEMINKAVSAITFGRLKPFEDLQNQKDTLEFFNTIAQSIKAGKDISGLTGDNIFTKESPNAEGEVGVFKLKSKASIAAPKASEDSRPWVKEFVTDVDMMKFDGQPFVTNMYDYTTAGEVTMGEHKIELMGGKSYVPYMMHKNNKKLGQVSNLAAFNSKENAEGFVRNAIEGGANLFAPHSGTLSQSWQFQHHTFTELVNLVLDKNILTNEELIGMFNNIIKSAGNKADFKQFREEYFKESGKKINNFSSFVKNPKEIVGLLDIDNNFAPNLRKTLNSTLSANKKFQEGVGIKNKEQFYEIIMDPLNAGVTGGEILGVIDFDPTTFQIVKTTPGATNHHPSFGWALMAKINGIYQPTEFYNSYDITDTYTKYNKGGVDVSKKSDGFKEFISSNVKSSAGAIPKIAKFNVGDLKSKAQILGLTGAASLDNAEKIMGNLEVAKKMEQELGKQPLTPGKARADAQKIKMATGWERGADKLWRLEIPDATLKDFEVSDLPKYMASQTRYAKLGDIIDAPELFKAYSTPRGEGKQALKDVVVEFLDTDDFRGAFTEKTQKIQISTNENVNKSPREMLSTMLHEIQHYIQFVEGFETGSTDASMSNIPVVELQIRNRAKALFNTYNQLVEESKQPGANISSIKDELQVIQSQYSKLKEEIAKPAKDLYKRAAGEVEARNVQRRMGLTNEERMGMLLLETEDVYRADQLLLSDAIQTTNLKSKAQMVDNNAKQVADLYAQMREGGGWAERQKINAILDQDPKLSYIYNNFKAITQMFEDAELLTKSGNCP